jgi:hypothetical protein
MTFARLFVFSVLFLVSCDNWRPTDAELTGLYQYDRAFGAVETLELLPDKTYRQAFYADEEEWQAAKPFLTHRGRWSREGLRFTFGEFCTIQHINPYVQKRTPEYMTFSDVWLYRDKARMWISFSVDDDPDPAHFYKVR